MPHPLRRLLAAPTFADEEQNRVATILHTILLAVTAICVFAGVVQVLALGQTQPSMLVYPALLLAWAPLIGDALCVAAGWLRLHWLPCCLFMALGKLGRYWLVAQTALPN